VQACIDGRRVIVDLDHKDPGSEGRRYNQPLRGQAWRIDGDKTLMVRLRDGDPRKFTNHGLEMEAFVSFSLQLHRDDEGDRLVRVRIEGDSQPIFDASIHVVSLGEATPVMRGAGVGSAGQHMLETHAA